MGRSAHLLIILLATAAMAGAMEVRAVQWGFDGKALPGHINLLSLLIANPGAAPMEGPLQLAVGGGFRAGAPWLISLYLAPGTARWVQFHPWVGDQDEDFSLTWQPSGEQIEIKAPERGPPATVMLTDSDRLTLAGAGAIKRFPDEIFPTTVAATDGLDAVVLDHAPRWEPPRRQAFIDWLRRGGTVHLLLAEGGGFPRFANELAVLEQPGERWRVGAGTVVRHQAIRAGFGLAQLTESGFAPAKLSGLQSGYYRRHVGEQFFEALAALVKPHHQWGLIYLLLIVYLLAIGPLAWLVARRRVDWRTVNAGLVGMIAGCSLLMWTIGRRGAGEQELLRSVGYAQSVGGSGWDATQWSSYFAVSSGLYVFQHAGEGNLYACPGESEAVDGRINDGMFSATLPLFSSRPFLHRAKLHGPTAEPKLRQLEAAASLTALALDLPEDWPQPITQARAVYRGRIHQLAIAGRALSLVPSSDLELGEFCKQADHRMTSRGGIDHETAEVLDAQFPALVAYASGGISVASNAVERPVDLDLVTLFVLAPQPKDFQVVSGGLGRQEGIVLYRVDLVLADHNAPAGISGQNKADP